MVAWGANPSPPQKKNPPPTILKHKKEPRQTIYHIKKISLYTSVSKKSTRLIYNRTKAYCFNLQNFFRF